MSFQLITTKDGSHSLHVPEMEENYHSQNGAITESDHIFIKNGYLFRAEVKKKVFEIGFGTGLNALLTALEAEKNKICTTYYSIEKYPIETNFALTLNFPSFLGSGSETIFRKIHMAEWNKQEKITPFFSLQKIQMDMIKDNLPENIHAGIIYFDAFGPDKQPDMWELPILQKADTVLNHGGIFVTYSVKGIVRRNLASMGYQIEKIPGPPGKIHILRGIKNVSSL